MGRATRLALNSVSDGALGSFISRACVCEGVCVCGGGGGGCEGVFVVGMGWDTRLALNSVSDGALGSLA